MSKTLQQFVKGAFYVSSVTFLGKYFFEHGKILYLLSELCKSFLNFRRINIEKIVETAFYVNRGSIAGFFFGINISVREFSESGAKMVLTLAKGF